MWPGLSLNLRSQTCAATPGLSCCSVESDMFQSEVSLSKINEIGLSSWMQILKGKKMLALQLLQNLRMQVYFFHLLVLGLGLRLSL